MPRGATIVVENSFNRGLITEFTAMNFPENAVTDADNVVFSELGSVTRRPGIDYEPDATVLATSTLSPNVGAYSEFTWIATDNSGTVAFAVQQIGTRVILFQLDNGAFSDSARFSIDLLTFASNGSTTEQIRDNPCQFTSGKGYLFISHPFCDPASVQFDSAANTVTAQAILIEVRDFERLADGLEPDQRPGVLSELHHYNLLNQGWYFDAIVYSRESSPGTVLDDWQAVRGDYPSNADIWWLYKDSTEVAEFRSGLVSGHLGPSQITLGNTPAPNGHYLYEAWNIDRTAKTGISGLPSQTSGAARPSSIEFFAGRIFYAGISADGYADKVYFSQIIESDSQFGACYQLNDPTSETIFDLLPSDGGVLSVPTIGKIISLQNLNDTLIVIGTNGVFAIRGADNSAFTANNYSVENVSTIGGITDSSIVRVDSNLLWWNYDSLLSLGRDKIGVYFEVENVSKQTIQEIIDNVPAANRPYIKGAYNKRTQIVQWLYSDIDGADPWTYNRILELNVASKAFYTHTISTSVAAKIVGIGTFSGERRASNLVDVTDNSLATVTTLASQDVQVETTEILPNSEIFKYSIAGNIGAAGVSGFTFGEQTTVFEDWTTLGGVDYVSYFYSGYRIRGEMLRGFSSTPIAVVVKNISGAEVQFKGVWDYGFKTSMPQEIYNPVVTYYSNRGWQPGEYLIRRLKVRGKGKSLQLYFISEGSAPFEIVGWSTFDTGGQQP